MKRILVLSLNVFIEKTVNDGRWTNASLDGFLIFYKKNRPPSSEAFVSRSPLNMDFKNIFYQIKDFVIHYGKLTYEFLFLDEKKEQSVIEEVQERAEIPETYLQRFRLHPLQDANQLQGRDEELAMMQRAYENWKISRSPLLIVGEFGAGMTSLLNAGTHIYPHAKILENKSNISNVDELVTELKKGLNYPEARTLKDLNTLPKQDTEQVIVFENIERLFLRKIHGFNLLEDFLLLIHATKKDIFWVATINQYSYYYLNQVIGFGSNFLSIIRLNPIKKDLIEGVITERNKGYECVYLKPTTSSGTLTQQIKNSDTTNKQQLLKDDFFNKLHAFAGGNISQAMLFWKRSVAYVKEKRVYVKAYEPKPIGQLSLEELFVLEAILQHTSLSNQELYAILRNSNKGSKLILEKLMENNLLYAKYYEGEFEPEYQINLLHLNAVKAQIHARLNRNIK